jgi:hypothetical protein
MMLLASVPWSLYYSILQRLKSSQPVTNQQLAVLTGYDILWLQDTLQKEKGCLGGERAVFG